MRIRINKAHFPVTVLGPGKRIGIWLQGCSIRCPGCISQDTWESNISSECEIDDILEWCRRITMNKLDGVTISGGEPFDQPEALRLFLKGLLNWRSQFNLDFDILTYSGYGMNHLVKSHLAMLEMIDAVIPEPYQALKGTDLIWRGSSNQTIVPLTEKGRLRYSNRAQERVVNRQIQLVTDEANVWLVGIPRKGDCEKLAIKCTSMGLDLGKCSWKT